MGNINISDLRPAGADLFLDSESYLNDLSEGEMTNTSGGDFSLYNCQYKNGQLASQFWCHYNAEHKIDEQRGYCAPAQERKPWWAR